MLSHAYVLRLSCVSQRSEPCCRFEPCGRSREPFPQSPSAQCWPRPWITMNTPYEPRLDFHFTVIASSCSVVVFGEWWITCLCGSLWVCNCVFCFLLLTELGFSSSRLWAHLAPGGDERPAARVPRHPLGPPLRRDQLLGRRGQRWPAGEPLGAARRQRSAEEQSQQVARQVSCSVCVTVIWPSPHLSDKKWNERQPPTRYM